MDAPCTAMTIIPMPSPTSLALTRKLPDSYNIKGFEELDFNIECELADLFTYKSNPLERRAGSYDSGSLALQFYKPNDLFKQALHSCVNDSGAWSFKMGTSDSDCYFTGLALMVDKSWPDDVVTLNIEIDSHIYESCKIAPKPFLYSKRVRDW